VSLDAIGTKGVFVDAIEEALIGGEIQMAVHSMKDMPDETAEGLVFAKPWKREDPRDVLILREAASLAALPPHAVIATGSKRRAFSLMRLRPDLNIVPIRGNIDTRIRKMHEQKLDGIVLAAAGLKRLGRESEITQYLSVEEMIPAPAQGVLAIELRADDTALLAKVNALSDAKTEREVRAERGFLKGIGGDCHLPIGAFADTAEDGTLTLRALFGSADGSSLKTVVLSGADPDLLGEKAVRKIREGL
jgi:hydroxymethylbilane synthase/uroporphyrinogen III methyltransferase/synthase